MKFFRTALAFGLVQLFISSSGEANSTPWRHFYLHLSDELALRIDFLAEKSVFFDRDRRFERVSARPAWVNLIAPCHEQNLSFVLKNLDGTLSNGRIIEVNRIRLSNASVESGSKDKCRFTGQLGPITLYESTYSSWLAPEQSFQILRGDSPIPLCDGALTASGKLLNSS